MTTTSIMLLMPLLILAGSALVVMLAIAFYRRHLLVAGLTLAGTALSGVSAGLIWRLAPADVTPLLRVDRPGLFLMGLLVLATFIIAAISYPYLERHKIQAEEYYLLLLLATQGGGILLFSNHFASFFLGIEILSVSLYGLVGYLRARTESIEAALKYLILAAVAASFLLFGISLVYAAQGTLAFSRFDQLKVSLAGLQRIPLLVGFGLLFVGIGFKLAVVPFHIWTPDVYQGAPAPITGFVATVSKGAIFGALLRLSVATAFLTQPPLRLVLALMAIASMLLGNLLALRQENVKRILAYSSIAHLGYLLVALLANTTTAISAAIFYLAAYIVTTLAAFVVVSWMSESTKDAEQISDYRSLYWKQPWLAALFSLALLSLIGMPLTAGFMGKLFVLTAGVGADLWVPVFALILGSAIGVYYYLRVVVVMFLPLDEHLSKEEFTPRYLPAELVMGFMILILLWLGLFPSSIINLIQTALAGFG